MTDDVGRKLNAVGQECDKFWGAMLEAVNDQYDTIDALKRDLTRCHDASPTLEKRLTNIEKRLTDIEKRLTDNKRELTSFQDSLGTLHQQIQSVYEHSFQVDKRLFDVELQLNNGCPQAREESESKSKRSIDSANSCTSTDSNEPLEDLPHCPSKQDGSSSSPSTQKQQKHVAMNPSRAGSKRRHDGAEVEEGELTTKKQQRRGMGQANSSQLSALRRVDMAGGHHIKLEAYFIFARVGSVHALSPVVIAANNNGMPSLISQNAANAIVRSGGSCYDGSGDGDRWLFASLSWPLEARGESDPVYGPYQHSGGRICWFKSRLRFLVVPADLMSKGVVLAKNDLLKEKLDVRYPYPEDNSHPYLSSSESFSQYKVLLTFPRKFRGVVTTQPFSQLCKLAEHASTLKDSPDRIEILRRATKTAQVKQRS